MKPYTAKADLETGEVHVALSIVRDTITPEVANQLFRSLSNALADLSYWEADLAPPPEEE